MKILQISFHTAPFGSAGKYDSGGLNIYVEKVSDQLSKNNFVTVLTAEKAESFVTVSYTHLTLPTKRIV